MIDFDGYLVDLSEVICVTPVREDSTGDRFFVIHFRGGGTECLPAKTGKRNEFIALVKMAHAARQIPDDDLA